MSELANKKSLVGVGCNHYLPMAYYFLFLFFIKPCMKLFALLPVLLFSAFTMAQTPKKPATPAKTKPVVKTNLQKVLDHPLVGALDKTKDSCFDLFAANGLDLKTNNYGQTIGNTYYNANFSVADNTGYGPGGIINEVTFAFQGDRYLHGVPAGIDTPAYKLPVNLQWGISIDEYTKIFGKPDTIVSRDSYSTRIKFVSHYFKDARNPHIAEYVVTATFSTRFFGKGIKNSADTACFFKNFNVRVNKWNPAYYNINNVAQNKVVLPNPNDPNLNLDKVKTITDVNYLKSVGEAYHKDNKDVIIIEKGFWYPGMHDKKLFNADLNPGDVSGVTLFAAGGVNQIEILAPDYQLTASKTPVTKIDVIEKDRITIYNGLYVNKNGVKGNYFMEVKNGTWTEPIYYLYTVTRFKKKQ